MSGLHHVELRPRSLRYYRRKDREDCAERRRDAVIVDAKTRHRFKLDTKRMGTPSGGRCPLCAKSRPSAMQQKERFLAAVLLWQLSGLFQTRFERGEKGRCFTSGDGAMIEGEG